MDITVKSPLNHVLENATLDVFLDERNIKTVWLMQLFIRFHSGVEWVDIKATTTKRKAVANASAKAILTPVIAATAKEKQK